MMPYFTYERALRAEEVGPALVASGGRTRVLAGGTELVPLLKDRLVKADHLVDIRGLVDEMGGILVGEGGGLRVGALVTLAELARHPLVRANYRALAQAAEATASPELRNQATLGGNLLQLTRCEYFRSGAPCYLNGGQVCFAAEGRHERHSIYPRGTSVSVNPSDPATALLAADASLEILAPSGATRTVPIAEALKDPDHDDPRFLALGEGELIVAVVLPPGERASAYAKAMERADWSFALASVAVSLAFDGEGRVADARVVLGGVAGTPRREPAVEAALTGRRLDRPAVVRAAQAACQDARPLPGNGYKVELVRGLLRRALSGLASGSEGATGRASAV